MSQPLPDASLDQLFRRARTPRAYLDRPVSEDQLRLLWELTELGPTSANILPARVVWCVSQEAKDKLADLSAPNNQERIRKAPVTAIIGMDLDFHEQLSWLYPVGNMTSYFADPAFRETNALRNSSLQGAYFILAARALGLDAGPMSGFDNAAVDRAFFGDKPRVRSNFICLLGYGDDSKLHDRLPRPQFETFTRIA